MVPVVTALLAALQVAAPPPQDTLAAYADPRAEQLVGMARQARATQQATLAAFTAQTQERASVLLRTPGRDRLVYRREMAARLDWHRDGTPTVTLLGAREYVPVPGRGVRVVQDAAAEALDVAFDPVAFTRDIGLGSFRFGPHPLNPGSEADYTFRSGGSTQVVLQDGGTLTLHELIIVPRRAAPELVVGTIWIEETTGRPVQEGFRRAAPIRTPGPLPFVGFLSIEPREILIEHALWERQWWMPRVIAIDGLVRAGNAALLPFRYERTYSDFALEGGDALETGVAPTQRAWQVVLPPDRGTLLISAALPASIFDEDAGPLPVDELAALRERLDRVELPRLRLAPGALALAPLDGIRYNRVEGLSFNITAGANIGGVQPFAEARIATAGRVLRGGAGLAATTAVGELGLGGYDRIDAADPTARPFDAGNSISTFFFGVDQGVYFAATGAELVRTSHSESRRPWTLRLYSEEHDSVALRTPFTFRRIFTTQYWLIAGPGTEPARQSGLDFQLALGRGVGPQQAQWRLQPRIELATGDFDYGKASLIASAAVPLLRGITALGADGLTVGVEVAGGASAGTVPGQAMWYMGGPATVRGYPGASAAGDGYWRARGEFGTSFPIVRVAVFSDVAQTWGRGGWQAFDFIEDHPRLLSFGIGTSFLEGLLRVDLARAVRFRPGWRMMVAVDNVL
jgi:hypothetical protein